MLGHVVRMAKAAGVTPGTVLPQYGRLFERGMQGGGIAVFKLGPKEVRIELVQCELFDIPRANVRAVNSDVSLPVGIAPRSRSSPVPLPLPPPEPRTRTRTRTPVYPFHSPRSARRSIAQASLVSISTIRLARSFSAAQVSSLTCPLARSRSMIAAHSCAEPSAAR